VKELIKEDLDLTDTETALPTTVSFLSALDIVTDIFAISSHLLSPPSNIISRGWYVCT